MTSFRPRRSKPNLARADGPPARGGRTLSMDIVVTSLLALGAASAAVLEAPAAIRVPLGILLVLFLPGHALVSAFFPSTDGPDFPSRCALSVALSLAAIPVLALAIDRSPWRVERVTIAVALAALTMLATVAATYLRARLAADRRYAVRMEPHALPPPRTWGRGVRAALAALTLAAALLVFGGYDVVKTRLTGQPTTEFALFNAAGEAQFYPRDVAPGQAAEIRISVVNHENRKLSYQLAVGGVGVALDPPPEITLANGETWSEAVRFTVTLAGGPLPVRFELRRADQPADAPPYRLLQLIVSGGTTTQTAP